MYLRKTIGRFALAMTAAVVAAIPLQAQESVHGPWSGAIVVAGQEIGIVIHFATAEGELRGSIDIPMQGAEGVALSNVRHAHPSIHFELMPGPRVAVFDGTVGTDSIGGAFTQSGMDGTFWLKPSDEAEAHGEHAEARSEHAEARGEHAEARGEHAEAHGEHGEAGHDEGGEEGEESGEYIAREQTWDKTRRGARLVLSFDAASNAFVGTVENTTEAMLCAVRVEVHLSSGTELGPTERTDVPSGKKIEVRLPTEGEAFESWTAHPEVSACNTR